MELRRVPINPTTSPRTIPDSKLFVGRAVVYSQWSELLYGCFRERLAPGCFDECLSTQPDLVATVDHDPKKIIGRSSAKTLRIKPGDDGIDVEVDQSEYTYARDLAVALDRGDISGMSFIFDVTRDTWTRDGDTPLRTVVSADIYEVAFVHFPAYSGTDAGMRSAPLAMPVAGEQRAIAAAKEILRVPLSTLRAMLQARGVS